MDSTVKSVYRMLIYVKNRHGLDEAGVVQLIEREETDWYHDDHSAYYTSDMTRFLRQYRVEQYVIMERGKF